MTAPAYLEVTGFLLRHANLAAVGYWDPPALPVPRRDSSGSEATRHTIEMRRFGEAFRDHIERSVAADILATALGQASRARVERALILSILGELRDSLKSAKSADDLPPMTQSFGANPKIIVDVWRCAVEGSYRYWLNIIDRETAPLRAARELERAAAEALALREREDAIIAKANEAWERRQRLGQSADHERPGPTRCQRYSATMAALHYLRSLRTQSLPVTCHPDITLLERYARTQQHIFTR